LADDDLRKLGLVRGGVAAIEAREILLQSAQATLDALDVRARSLLSTGTLTGEAALAMWAERAAIMRLVTELDGRIASGRRAAADLHAKQGA
jgi:hypothetical protein